MAFCEMRNVDMIWGPYIMDVAVRDCYFKCNRQHFNVIRVMTTLGLPLVPFLNLNRVPNILFVKYCEIA